MTKNYKRSEAFLSIKENNPFYSPVANGGTAIKSVSPLSPFGKIWSWCSSKEMNWETLIWFTLKIVDAETLPEGSRDRKFYSFIISRLVLLEGGIISYDLYVYQNKSKHCIFWQIPSLKLFICLANALKLLFKKKQQQQTKSKQNKTKKKTAQKNLGESLVY